MLELLNKYYKHILYVILGLVVVYLMIYLFTPKPQILANYKASIDSLIKINNTLIERQSKLDNTLVIYNSKIDSIDGKIDSVKEKTIIIKKYYHEIRDRIDTFHSTQVDSFFKQRYKY